MMKGKAPQSVDEYLLYLPDDVREVLEKLRVTIKNAAPKAEESISYMMPAYKYKGSLIYFGAFKNHCSLFAGKQIPIMFAKELAGYKVAAGTIQFTAEKPLPMTLVKKIVKVLIERNEAKAMLKASAKKKVTTAKKK